MRKLAEAATKPANHRYSMSRACPSSERRSPGTTRRTWGVELDVEAEITNTIGSKEGFSHLMWVLLDRGDAAIVPSPSYPIHIYGPLFAGADLRQVPMRSLAHPDERGSFAEEFFDRLTTAYDIGWPKPRVLVISFPHNPTGACVELDFMQRVVDFCREREMIVVHDFAYADVGFDGYRPPSILQAEGAKECAVELYSMTKSFSMAGWRVAFLLGNADVVQALVKLKSYLDYGMFQPVQIAATVTINEATDFPAEVCATYESRRDALVDGLDRIGWHVPKPGGSMFVWAPIPEPYAELDSVEFSSAPRPRRRRRPLAGRRIRSRRRGLCPLRPDREREAHRPGDPQPPPRPPEAGLTCRGRRRRGHADARAARLAARSSRRARSRRQPHRRRPRRRAGDRHPRTRRWPGRRRARRVAPSRHAAGAVDRRGRRRRRCRRRVGPRGAIDRPDPALALFELGAQVAEACAGGHADPIEVLGTGIASALDADWVVVMGADGERFRHGSPPDSALARRVLRRQRAPSAGRQPRSRRRVVGTPAASRRCSSPPVGHRGPPTSANASGCRSSPAPSTSFSPRPRTASVAARS